MNDRIQALIKEATDEIWGNCPHNGSPQFEGYELNAEKFAVLLVQECASIDFYKLAHIGTEDDHNVTQVIKDYFGVK